MRIRIDSGTQTGVDVVPIRPYEDIGPGEWLEKDSSSHIDWG